MVLRVNEALIDHVFFAVAAALGLLVLVSPNSFIWLASYGGRLRYRPPIWMVTTTRICAALMLIGIVLTLIW